MGLVLFIVVVLAFGAGLIGLFIAETDGGKVGAAASMVGALILLLVISTAHVGARSVGVVTSFGKVTGVVGSGMHLTAPWASVDVYPATINTLRLGGAKKTDDNDGPCVTVRLANQTTACVDVTMQWKVDTGDRKGIEELYVRWRGFDNIEPNLIRPQAQHALMQPFEGFDPLRVLNGSDKPSQTTVDLEQATRVATQSAVGHGITIVNVTINLVHYDDTTQSKLNAYAQALADTRIAEQRQKTAAAQKAANDALAAGGSLNQLVITQNCLDMVERMVKEGKALPAAFTCSPGATPVVVGK